MGLEPLLQRKYFLDEHELFKPSGGLIRDVIPERARYSVVTFAGENFPNYTAPLRFIVDDLDIDPSIITGSEWQSRDAFNKLIRSAHLPEWLSVASAIYYFLDAVPVPSRKNHYSPKGWPWPQDFRNRLNDRLVRHYSAFQMTEAGTMEESGPAITGAAIAEARAILVDARLQGPDRQFQAAVLCLLRRPDPNPEGAVTGAANAVEGVIRIALDDPGVTLGDGAKNLMKKHNMDGALMAALSSLYGYASNKGGRHGLTGQPDSDLNIAEYVLHQAAAAIIFVARLEKWATVDSSSLQALPTSAEPAIATG